MLINLINFRQEQLRKREREKPVNTIRNNNNFDLKPEKYKKEKLQTRLSHEVTGKKPKHNFANQVSDK